VDTENPVQIENAGFRSVREIIIVSTMTPFFIALLALIASTFQTRAAQQAEILALRHQIAVLQQSRPRRLRLRQSDRLLWIWLSRFWPGWRRWLRILKPDTVLRWHRRAFTRYWTRKSRRRPGRPGLTAAIRDLIEQMGQANFLWGAPRIHGELLKLGIQVAPSTVGKYLRRRRNPPSQTWRTFLTNHMKQMASMDFFTVPTATFRVLFVFIVLSHDRRRVMHFNVTDHPSEEWTAQQIREAFPWEAPRYLIRDRDAIFGGTVVALTSDMGIEEVITAPRSPWQNPYVERLIGSIRRECLDHVIVWNETALRRILRSYFQYYEKSRTHLALAKDAPEPRAVDRPENGRILAIPQVGGLHHRYERRAA
jgi:putative transposase